MTDWKKLQNGSDIRGVALAGVEGEDVNLTSEVAGILGRCFVAWLSKRNNKQHISVSVGHDPRLSSTQVKDAVIEGLEASGAKAFDCELASTPAMFMTTIDNESPVDGAIMVTASHLPWNRNGLKFFTPQGGLGKKDIKELLLMAEQGEYEKENLSGEAAKWNFMEKYCQLLRDYIKGEVNKGDQPLAGLDIVVDAGNGSGGFFPEKVLKPLGADTSGGIYLNPDGHFPNHAPNPESTDAMMAICRAVTRHHADLGIIFDTDVDRSAIVDHYVDPINRNSLIALIAAVILREHPGTTIVTDSVTSEGLAEFIKAHGGKHHRFKRGYRNVIDEAIRSLREISNYLSPQVLNDFGLARGIQNFISRSAALHSVRIRFTTNLRAERFDTDIEVILYRVVCELINNSLKHSGCSEINLSLSSGGDTLTLDYSDNGCGFNPAAVMDCGMGLSNIASRINSLGGTFDIASAKGKGMRAAIRVNTQEEPAPLNRNHNRKRRRR